MKILKSKSVYIGQGFLDSQLLWLIPLVHGYCEKKKIKTLIFERKLAQRIKKNILIKNILKKYHIIYYKNLFYSFKNNNLFLILEIIFLLLKSFAKSFQINRNTIMSNKKNWFKFQLNHSIWDASILRCNDGDINPSFFSKFKASFSCYRKVFEAQLLIKLGVRDYFLGHSVYGARAFLAKLRTLSSNNIFCHSGFTIYKQPINRDSSWCFLDQNQFKTIQRVIGNNHINKYWALRNLGYGNYEDSRIAASLKNKVNKKYQNVIFLHIFRDSPFADIDRNRIFEDYIVWVKETLRIISKSKENWTIRLHPNYIRWGEDQTITINKICKSVFGNSVPKNIEFENNLNSNVNVFKTAKRVITFNGTSHLEAAANFIKPIIISDVMLNFIYKNLCHKPRNLNEYEKLLLAESNSNIFSLSKKDSLKAKKLMFIREKVLKFEKEVGGFHIYANDSKKKFLLDYSQTKNKIKKNYKFLKKNGEKLSKNIKISMSPTYINFIK